MQCLSITTESVTFRHVIRLSQAIRYRPPLPGKPYLILQSIGTIILFTLWFCTYWPHVGFSYLQHSYYQGSKLMDIQYDGSTEVPRYSLKRLTLSKCFWKRTAVSMRCRLCISIITRSVSRAWCGRNSLSRWWMWINSKLKSSTFSARFGESGHRTRRSRRSRKLTSSEWFSFRSSRRLSKCWGYSLLMPWENDKVCYVVVLCALFCSCALHEYGEQIPNK